MIREIAQAFERKFVGLVYDYQQVFNKKSPHTHAVLKDLAKFCRAHESTFLPDARAHAVLEGRREVWLKIVENLNLTIEELYELHRVKEIKTRKQENTVGNA
jgi:hypothetical protein